VLSHTLTFHERCPAGEWHLVEQRVTYAGQGRGHGRGEIFRADGQLAASFVQDAMIRADPGTPANSEAGRPRDRTASD
jgi:acyl-CoA thioesterase